MRVLHLTIPLATALLLPLAGAHAVEVSILSGPEDPLIHGVRGNDTSNRCSLSADGQEVAFESFAFQLVPDDFNQSRDVFVRDRTAGTTSRVSVDALGAEVEAGADYPAISGDGRYVAFSVAGDLVGAGPTFFRQTYLYDRASQSLALITRSTGGGYSNGSSDQPVINTDSSHVAFMSSASDLVAGDTNGKSDAFVYDIAAGTIALASITAGGVQGDEPVYGVDISRNGNIVAFETASSTLSAADGNGARDVYAKNMTSGALLLASVDSGGVLGSADSYLEDLADEGQWLLFSTSNALVPADANALSDIYARRLGFGTTARVSSTLAGADGDGAAFSARVSADGRRVVFSSSASNLVAAADGSLQRIFLRDFDAGTLSLLPTGNEIVASMHSLDPAGTVLCFSTWGSDVDTDDRNGVTDVYVLEIATGSIELVSRSESAEPVYTGNGDSLQSSISADGRYVLFESLADDLDFEQDDISLYRKLYFLDQDSGTIERVATAPGGVDADRLNPELSGDGRYVVFDSYATNLVAGDDTSGDVFRFDREDGSMVRISEALAGGPGHGELPSVSDDGTRVAFISDGGSGALLDPADTNGEEDVYLWDAGVLRRISVATGGGPADDDSRDARISADGQWLVFESQADNLTADAEVGSQNLFVADLTGNALHCVTCGHDLAIDAADLSDDGTRVIFNVVPMDTPTAPFENPGVYVYERLTGSVRDLGIPFDWDAAYGVETRISGDGTTVAFSAGISVGGPFATAAKGLFEENYSLFRYRIDTGELTEELAGVAGPEGYVYELAIDADGTHLLASADAALLPALDRNGESDIYQVQRTPGEILLGAPFTAEEASGSVTVTLERHFGSDGIVRASLVSVDGTALAGEDFVLPTDTVEWLDGETGSKELVITLLHDGEVEPDQVFQVKMGELSGGAIQLGGDPIITIIDAPPLEDPVFSNGFEDRGV